ncbi:MAG: DUF721 domain-containing protein [Bacteroidia bacterium]|nr:MAG: DUF721 domain-containing protein [Bacteroidia bacterium]
MGEYSIGEALQQFLNKSNLKRYVQAYQIEDVWKDIMGTTIAKYTDKIEIYNQTLVIYTQVAPLKNELAYQRDQIIQRVNEALGKKTINEVVIK